MCHPGHNLSQQIQSNCSSQVSELDSQDSTMQDLHLGGSLLRDIARQNISHINNPHIQEPLFDGWFRF